MTLLVPIFVVSNDMTLVSLNGVHKLNLASMGTGIHSYNGPTDSTISSSSRNFGIGGYTRTRSEDNWRFFNDLYLDYTLAHVIIGDNSVYDSCTVKEVQIPTAWSDGSISIDVNQGSFENGDMTYLFIVDSDGEVSDGFEVVISGEVSGCVDGEAVGCSTGLLGICSSGLRTCLDGVYGECVADNEPVEEICGNGVDEDCDGSDLVCVENVSGTVVDNLDLLTSYSDGWSSGSFYSGFWGDDYMYSSVEAGDWFLWEVDLEEGVYDVYAWWVGVEGRPVDSVYEVSSLDGVDGVVVDQSSGGEEWGLLGRYNFSGSSSVRLVSGESVEGACADAVRFVFVGELVEEEVACVHDADVDCDGEVSVEELGGYIGLWLGGGVSMGEVMGAIGVWVG